MPLTIWVVHILIYQSQNCWWGNLTKYTHTSFWVGNMAVAQNPLSKRGYERNYAELNHQNDRKSGGPSLGSLGRHRGAFVVIGWNGVEDQVKAARVLLQPQRPNEWLGTAPGDPHCYAGNRIPWRTYDISSRITSKVSVWPFLQANQYLFIHAPRNSHCNCSALNTCQKPSTTTPPTIKWVGICKCPLPNMTRIWF